MHRKSVDLHQSENNKALLFGNRVEVIKFFQKSKALLYVKEVEYDCIDYSVVRKMKVRLFLPCSSLPGPCQLYYGVIPPLNGS